MNRSKRQDTEEGKRNEKREQRSVIQAATERDQVSRKHKKKEGHGAGGALGIRRINKSTGCKYTLRWSMDEECNKSRH